MSYGKKDIGLRLVIMLAVVVCVFFGWRLFWFLTDDAFIAFRYVSNSVNGFGLVWNPPPFRAVEGYTSFLWVVIMDLVWRIGGIEPPQAANWISLFFGYATLYVVYLMIERMVLPRNLVRYRLLFLSIVMLGIVSNRTFLAWLSSGLETAMFNFFVIWWIYIALSPAKQHGSKWVFLLSFSALGASLARPDGILFYIASLVLLLIHLWKETGTGEKWKRLMAAFPLLVLPGFFIFRYLTYGELLPNTYYAKYTGVRLRSGIRYFMSFVIEYGVWVWLILAACWVGTTLYRIKKDPEHASLKKYIGPIVVSIVLLHWGYYTFAVGGDHFEYRVYSFLIPLLFLSAIWMMLSLTSRPVTVCLVMALFIFCSWPIPWLHWYKTNELTTREETNFLETPLASSFPPLIRIPVARFDKWQQMLISNGVCMRHQEHKIFYEFQTQIWPTREEGLKYSWSERNVLSATSVGYAAWVFPEVAIIDKLGLNDYVIARTPPPIQPPGMLRYMAHERRPPPGYVECFQPNIFRKNGQLVIEQRSSFLSDEQIRSCEDRDW